MSTFMKLYAAREEERDWNRMYVGPLLEQDLARRRVRRVRGVSQGPPLIYYGPITTPAIDLGYGGSSTSSSTTEPLLRTFKGEDREAAKSNTLYYGTRNYVVAKHGSKYQKIWERSRSGRNDEVKSINLLEKTKKVVDRKGVLPEMEFNGSTCWRRHLKEVVDRRTKAMHASKIGSSQSN